MKKALPKAHIIMSYVVGEENGIAIYETKTFFFGCALRSGRAFMQALQLSQSDQSVSSVSYHEGQEHVFIPIQH